MTNNLHKIFISVIFLCLTNITLAQLELKIVSPVDNQEWEVNKSQGISWIYKGVEKIDISYSLDKKVWTEIYSDISPELGVISWNVPNIPGKSIFIKIEDSKKRINYISKGVRLIQRKELNKTGNIEDQTLIMPLGNSITYDNRVSYNGISPDPRPVGDRTGYRYPLYNLLTNAGFNFQFTGSEHSGGNYLPAGYDANAGFSGIRDDQLARLLRTGRLTMEQYGVDRQVTPGPYLESYPADIILLHIGTNGNNSTGGTDPTDVEEILDEIKRYEDSTGTEITVVLARIIDRVPNQNYVTTFNDNIEAMALDRVNNPANDAYPDKIVVIDMQVGAGINYVISEDPDGTLGDMNDIYHPNDMGFSKMANVWYNAIADIIPSKPSIISQPQNAYVLEGDSITFSVTATGNDPLNYQWIKNGINISGANSSSLVLKNILAEDDSSIIKCIVTNGVGSIESDSAVLYVTSNNERVQAGLEISYNFNEGSGQQIIDNSLNGNSVNQEIQNISTVNWIPYGLSINEKTDIFSQSTPQNLFNNVLEKNELSVELWIKPHLLLQSGPARIFTYSADGSNRNFTIGQREDRYIVRLRTTDTDLNGLPELATSNSVVDTSLTHLLFTKDSTGTVKLFINGVPRVIDIRSGNFSNWDSLYLMGLANEFNSNGVNRYWLGNYYFVAAYSRALSEKEVLHNYSFGFEGKDKLLYPPSDLSGNVTNESLVNLNWTDNESRENGYIIERKANDVDSNFVIIDSVGKDISNYTDSYDKYVNSYLYRVRAFSDNTGSDYSNTIQVDNIITGVHRSIMPESFKLYQNYPNPFNPTTTITYYIPYKSIVSLQIFNVLGELITSLKSNEIVSSGLYSIKVNAEEWESGVYFYRLKASLFSGEQNFSNTKKLILLK